MKHIRKTLISILLAALMTMALAGCGKTKCDFCGEMKSCKTVSILGTEVHICKDCADAIK